MTQRYARLRDEALSKAADLAGELVSGFMTDKDGMKHLGLGALGLKFLG